MKLEKFDLEKALNGAKVVTRDGREVTQFTKFETESRYCLFGLLDRRVGRWTIEGYFLTKESLSNEDLFIEGKVQSIWVNVYRKDGDEGIFIGNRRYTSQEDAIEYIHQNDTDYIKTIEITDEV